MQTQIKKSQLALMMVLIMAALAGLLGCAAKTTLTETSKIQTLPPTCAIVKEILRTTQLHSAEYNHWLNQVLEREDVLSPVVVPEKGC